jgi:hypothetical protein
MKINDLRRPILSQSLPEKPNGRPPKPLDWAVFEELCNIQCTQGEIASVLRLHSDTVRDRVEDHYGEPYSVIQKRFAEHGRSSLRRTQFNLAKKSAGMAIFLGKQYLGQKDNDHAITISPEIAEQFAALMNQLKYRQKVIMVESPQDAEIEHDPKPESSPRSIL